MVFSSLCGADADWTPLKVCASVSALLGPLKHRDKKAKRSVCMLFLDTNSCIMCVVLALLPSLAITVFVVVIA